MGSIFDPDLAGAQRESRRVANAIERIQDMLNDDRNRWRFAQDTLESLAAYGEEHGRFTEAQYTAIDNIENSVHNR